MPHFNLRYFLETLYLKQSEDVFLLQIGAMDGKSFDPVHEFITRFQWQALMVEPMEEHFLALQENYKSQPAIAFENLAIAEHNGSVTMHYIPSEHVACATVPSWGKGASSLYSDRNALAFPEIKPLVQQTEVACMTLPSLLKKHKVKQIDMLQIDAEGYDYHIVKQLDFETFLPKVINLEIINIPNDEKRACKKLLDSYGYLHTKAGYDLLAVQPLLCHQ